MTKVWIFLAVVSLALPFLLKVILQAVIAPIRIRHNQTMSARFDYEETRAEILTPEFQDFIGRTIRQFSDLGFAVAANVSRAGVVTGHSAIQILLVNRTTNDVAIVAIAYSSRTRSMQFGIRSRFADGKRIVTANTRNVGIFPADPDTEHMNFSWARDAATLNEAHRRRLRAAGRADDVRVSFVSGTEIAYMQGESERERNRFVASGYKRLDRSSNVYRFTWKGAYLSTWKSVQPIRRWRIAHRDRRAWRVWKELGMDTWRHAKDKQMSVAPDTVIVPATAACSDGRSIEPAFRTSSASTLDYQNTSAVGDFRQESVQGTLTIHFRNPSVAQFLLREWGSLLWIACLVLALGWSLLSAWSSWRLYSSMALPPGFPRPRLITPGLLIWPALLGLQTWQLIRGLSRAKGISIVKANVGGLGFTNAAGPIRSGRIDRENLDRLLIRIDTPGMFRRLYRLEARTFESSKPVPLFVGPSKSAMVRARKSLAQAMGMEVPGTE